MITLPKTLETLIEQLARLPGVGRKSAMKIAYNILELDDVHAKTLARAIVEVKEKVHPCKQCHHHTQDELCSLCSNPKRDASTLCVVDTSRDLLAIERTSEYRGLYHVLLGRLSPLDGVRPRDLTIDHLLERASSEHVKEVILANSPTLEGETTASYIQKRLEPLDVKVTRIAHGVPIGGDLEFSDEMTLLKALQGRHEYD